MIKPLISFLGWEPLAGLALVAALGGGAIWWTEHQREVGRLEEREVWQRKAAIDQAEAEIRRKEVAQQHQEIIDGAKRESLRLEVERNAVVADGVRLRQQYAAALQARCAARTPVAGPPADDPIGVFAEVFGQQGRHARSAFGVVQIPLGACVEIELIAEVA